MYSCSRLRLAGLIAVLLVAACGSDPRSAGAQDLGSSFLRPESDFVAREQLPTRPLRQFSANDPARILVIGDSLAQGFGIFLDKRVEERDLVARVTNRGRTSTGLSRSDFYDWPAEFARQAPEVRPDVVVVHFGSNDNQSVVTPNGNIRKGTEGWETAYGDQVRRILEIAVKQQAVVYWLGPAPDRGSSLNQHMNQINPIIEAENRAVQGIYIPLSPLVAGPNGEFAKTTVINGRSVTIRSGDGSHFTGEGYYYVADQLLADMEQRMPSMFNITLLADAGALQ